MIERFSDEYFQIIKENMNKAIDDFKKEEDKSGNKIFDYDKLKQSYISGHMSAIESISEQKGEPMSQMELLKYEYYLRRILEAE